VGKLSWTQKNKIGKDGDIRDATRRDFSRPIFVNCKMSATCWMLLTVAYQVSPGWGASVAWETETLSAPPNIVLSTITNLYSPRVFLSLSDCSDPFAMGVHFINVLSSDCTAFSTFPHVLNTFDPVAAELHEDESCKHAENSWEGLHLAKLLAWTKRVAVSTLWAKRFGRGHSGHSGQTRSSKFTGQR
jgi:hypothetical protein